MIKKIVYCDRCKRECTGSSYFTIDIWAEDIHETNDGRVSMSTASQNMRTNFTKALAQDKHYCESCINKLERFLIGENVK